jgi:hypothetical protein
VQETFKKITVMQQAEEFTPLFEDSMNPTFTEQIKPLTTHKAGNHVVSIGRDGHQLAILSLNTGEWVELKRTKTNNRLRKLKRKFKHYLTCDKEFFFERLDKEQMVRVMDILKGKK